MKRGFRFGISILCLLLFTVSCANNNGQDGKDDYEFYYYPKKNVYYDVEKKSFLYSLDGAKTWDSLRDVSSADPGTLGQKVIIRSLVREVYKNNETHRNLYKGRLYNVIKSDTAVATAPEISERKIPKSRTKEVKPANEEEKAIRGIKKFLNKIFGKHKKKQEDQ